MSDRYINMKNKKVILVTGASSGMGRDTVIKLLQRGHTVYAAARRTEKMKQLDMLGARVVKMDITHKTDCEKLIRQIEEEEGRLDVLVNNAGFGLYGAVEDTTIEDARYQFEVNIFGLARITQLALPMMRSQGSGTIINISSMGGKMYTALGAWYHATKHALEGWSDCLRIELKQFNINVVVVEPGIIATEFGNVVSKPMLQRSGHTVYGKLAKAVSEILDASYKKGDATPVGVLGKLIADIAEKKAPRTRYVKGKMAKPLIWIRKYMGDQIFDKALMSRIK